MAQTAPLADHLTELYRAFNLACRAAVAANNSILGPSPQQYVAALITRPNFFERNLGSNWDCFAQKFPKAAHELRIFAAGLRVTRSYPLWPVLPLRNKILKNCRFVRVTEKGQVVFEDFYCDFRFLKDLKKLRPDLDLFKRRRVTEGGQ